MIQSLRTTVVLGILFAVCWSDLTTAGPIPLVRLPTSYELQRADVVLVVKLSREVRVDDFAAADDFASLPMRDAVYSGPRVRGKAVRVLKGSAPSDLNLPAGAPLLYGMQFSRPARAGEQLLLLLRETDGRMWIYAYGHPNARPAIHLINNVEDRLAAPMVRYTQEALRALNQPSQEAAVSSLVERRAKVPAEQQWIFDMLLRQWREPSAADDQGNVEDWIDKVIHCRGVNCEQAWQHLIDASRMLSVGDIRRLAKAEDLADFDRLQSILMRSVPSLAREHPELCTELARLSHLPEEIRLHQYARATGFQHNTVGFKRVELRDGSLAVHMQDSGSTRRELIEFLGAMAKRVAADPHARNLGLAGCILSELRWLELEPLAMRVFRRSIGKPQQDGEPLAILVQDMGPYDDAISEVIARYHQFVRDGEVRTSAVLLQGLAWSRHPNAIALVRDAAEAGPAELKQTAYRLQRELAVHFGPDYAGRTADEKARMVDNLTREFLGPGADQHFNRPHDTPALVSRRFRILLKLGGRVSLEKLWETVRAEMGETLRTRRIVRLLKYSRSDWINSEMNDLWKGCRGTPLEPDVFWHLVNRGNESQAQREAFARAVLLDSNRRAGTRSNAASFLCRTPSESAVHTLYEAMRTAQWRKQGDGKNPWPAPQVSDIYGLANQFVEAAVDWKGKPVMDWLHELAHEGKIETYQLSYAIRHFDPQLVERRNFRHFVRLACQHPYETERDRPNQERCDLDRLFGRMFFGAASDQDEVQAWLDAFDTGRLTRREPHWVERAE